MAKRRILVPERLPAVRASEYVCVSVELPKGLHAKAQEVARAYGLSLSAWLRSLAYERVGYEARLKPGEIACSRETDRSANDSVTSASANTS
jgi:hypothetical protein